MASTVPRGELLHAPWMRSGGVAAWGVIVMASQRCSLGGSVCVALQAKEDPPQHGDAIRPGARRLPSKQLAASS